MIDSVQARFREGYARRFEIALAGALVLHVLAVVLVPPKPLPLPKVHLIPDAMRLEQLPYRPPEIEILEPEDVPRPSLTGAALSLTGIPDETPVPVPEVVPQAPPAPPGIVADPPVFLPRATRPALIKSVDPAYPSLAREAGAEGTVILDLTVSETGQVQAARVVRSDTIESLEEAARRAALQWLFTPGRQRDHAVPCIVRVSIRFRLS